MVWFWFSGCSWNGVAVGTDEMAAAGGGEGAERTYARPLPFFLQLPDRTRTGCSSQFFFLLTLGCRRWLSLSADINEVKE